MSTWGTITLNINTGAWTFTADAAALNSLDDGDSEALVLRARVTDAASGTDTETFTITLNGAADAPSATLADATSDADGDGDATTFNVTETTSSTLTNIATITVTDPDTDHPVSAFTISDNRFEVAKNGNVFTLRIKAGQTFDFDESASDNTFTFTVAGAGLASTTFTGTIIDDPADNNAVPTLSGAATAAITEDATGLTATGNMNFDDADSDDGHNTLIISTGFASSVPVADIRAHHTVPADPDAATATAAGGTPADITGAYGTWSFSRNNTTGVLTWTYTLDNDNAVVQGLREGQRAYEKLAVSVEDDEGATSPTRIITVTITGANDDPVLDVHGRTPASAYYHGVKFTFNEPGPDGNAWSVNVRSSSVTPTPVMIENGNRIILWFNTDNSAVALTSQKVLDLWDDHAPEALKDRITATLEDNKSVRQSDLHAQAATDFTGGSEGGTQASLLFHGIRFTVVQPGASGNGFNVVFNTQSGSNFSYVGSSTLAFNIDPTQKPRVTTQDLLDLWGSDGESGVTDIERGIVTLLAEGPAQEAALTDLIALGPVFFSGGANAGDYIIDDERDTEDNTPSVSHNFGVSDPDNGEQEGGSRAPTYAILSGTGSDAATVSAATGTAPNLTYTVTKGTGGSAVTWGTIALHTRTGAWTFTADAAALNSLDAGETELIGLQVRVTDTDSATDTESFTITLNGAVETPPLVLDAASDDTGNAYKGDSGVADTGQLTLAATPATTGTLDYGGSSGVYTGTHGTLTIDANGKWSYALTSDDAALDTASGGSFDDGETITETFAVTITDGGDAGSGAKVTFDLTITIGGRDEVSGTDGRDDSSEGGTDVTGSADDEILQGGDERDVITTGGGNDLVIGGYGNDDITLGAGAETVFYRYSSGSTTRADDGGDIIDNFELGVDKIVLVDTDTTAHDHNGIFNLCGH